ncbi:MAG: imidazole glycerol phosphate synthase subunit HisH, partial [Candidatus Omnitrophica bacterium]|nr:imidazole glycerol phosphate synthase subunit HisH [Candidatus Omnitrophota bacterium]
MSEYKDLKISIIDYHMGNLFSVVKACAEVGLKAVITHDKERIASSDAIILPGVGAFGDAMQQLRDLDILDATIDFIKQGKPYFGICLGMQLLMSESEEFGTHKGFDVISGKVVRLDPEHEHGRIAKVPQVGWNQIYPNSGASDSTWKNTPLAKMDVGEYMYFVHSFVVQPEDPAVVLTETNYEGVTFCSTILKGNIFAVQYHPEKSGDHGMHIY